MQSCTVVKQISLWGLAGFGAFCSTLILLCQWPGNPLKHQIQSAFLGVDFSSENTTDSIEDVEVLKEIERVIDIDRRMVRSDMTGYQYPNGNYNISASKLEDLVIDENGQPVRSIIVTSWRSGSNFLNGILASQPGSFQHFEPFVDYGKVRVRHKELAAKAIKRIRALLNCEYSALQGDGFFEVLRYEDLAADPYGEVKELFKFLGREFHPNVKEYLDTHTKTNSGDQFSTFRNTKTTPYHWRTDLEFEEVEEIQETCSLAMKYWGYLPAMNATHLREFHPVTDYDLSL